MSIATVVAITGQAFARDEDGNLRELSVGDTLQEGETLVTSTNGEVELDFDDGLPPTTIGGDEEVAMNGDVDAENPADESESATQDDELDAILTALEDEEGDILELLEATAAGGGPAGGGGGGSDFVQLARITESVEGLQYEFDGGIEGGTETVEFSDLAAEEEPVATISIDDIGVINSVDAEEGNNITITGTVGGDARQGDTVTLTVGEDNFTGTVSEELTYAIDVPGSVLAENDTVEGEVTGTDENGNSYTAETDGDYDVRLARNSLETETDEVFEAGLPDGSDVGDQTVTTGGDLNLASGWSAVAETGSTANGSFAINADGTYSYTLENPADHSEGAVTDVIEYTTTDEFGNTQTNTLTVAINDDGPTADIALVDEASVTLDETIGGEGAFDDITDSNPDPFNNSYGTPIGAISGIALVDASGSDAGADSDGATTSVSLSLTGAEGSDSGLATTDGTPIDLYTEDDGTITGRTGAEDGDVIFAISINDDGKVSVAQYAALEHPNVDSDDEAVSLDGKLNAVVTVTDGDGDEATDSEAIGNLITFEDDGPTADIALVDEASVTLDETIGGEGAFDDITDSNPDPFNNSYGTPIGAISGIALVDASGSDAGADSDGATTSVSLSLTGAEGSDSGLATTDGTPIDLYTEDDGTITGRTGAEDGDVIFAISINDDGKVSVAQYAALEHPNVDSDDEAVSLDGKLNAVVTVTDGDGDEATDSEAIGNLITFEDDGPTADIALVDEASVTLDETIGGEGAFDDITDSNPDPFNNSYGTPIGAISGIALVDASGSDAGADSDGATTSVSLSLTGAEGSDSGLATTDGTPIDLYTEDDGTITGRTGAEDGDVIFAISINDDGKVSVAQYAALEHPNVDSDDEAVSLDGKLNAVVTVTDGDGDEATDSEAIGNLITFEDDGPTADIALVDEASVTLDETIGGEGAFDDITDSNPDPFNNSYGTPIGAISGIALVDASGSDAGADSDGATTSVSLSLTGAEGSDSGLATTDGTPIDLYTEDDGTITGRTGAEDGDVIFAISINDDGKVSVAQYAALEHPNVDSDDEAVSLDGKLNAVVTVTDGDGDEATDSEAIGNLITFEDDGPTADIALVDEASVTLDETIGGEGAFDDITDSNPDPFNNSYGTPIGAISGIALVDASGSDAGADSDGATTSVSLSLTGAEGSDSGLATTDGTPIDLYTEDDGTITGRTGAEDGDVIFAISINDDGKVSVAQYAALEHPNVDSDDEAVSLDGKLNAVVTVTDGDGDEATDSEAIGNLITFEDDGPTADIALVDEASVTLDETIGGEGAFDDITDSNPDPFNNSYGTPIGAISGIALVDASGSDAGADSDGATTSVSLSLTGAEGSDSGLATTDGTPIDLYTEDDGTITGRTGAEDGDVIFAISINDDGKVSVAQYAALEHPNVDSDDEAVSLDGKLNAVVTVTDGDGDEATDSEAIGNLITFEDDGPTADIALVDEASVTLDETIGGEGAFDDITDSNPDPFNNSYGTPIGAISGIALVDASGSDAGADSDGATTSVSLSLTGAEGSDSGLATTDGTPIDLYTEDDGTITGRTGAEDGDVIFAISINDDGKVSVAQYAALEHPNVDSDDEAVSLDGKLNAVVTVTDGDGDEATDSEAIGNLITFEDDGPTADIALVDEASVTLDETIGGEGAFDDITDSNPDPFNNSYGTPIGAISGIALVDASGSDAGADSDGATTSVSLSLTGAEGSDSGLATTDGTPIDLYTEDDGTITGRTGAEDGDVIFAISINDDGKVSVAQYAALEHPNVDSDDEAVSLDGKLNAVVTVTDGDGDEATDSEAIGNLITFEDDGPTADIALVDEASVTLDETIGGEGAFDDITDSNPDPFNNSYGTPIGAISGIALVDASGSDAGADSDGATTSVSLSLTGAEGSDSGLATTDGTPIDLYTEDDGTITGRTGAEDGDVIFAISINDDGKVSVAQYAALEHPNVDSDDEAVSLDGKLNAVVTVTDGDGDEATDSEAIGNLITFEDDGPTADIALVDEASVTLDETIGGEGAFDDITDSNPDPFNNSYGTPIGAISGIALVDASGSDAGADSDGATTSVSLSLTGAEGSDSGLATTDGTPIDLYTEDDGTITGRTGAEDGDVIFAISINDDGKVSVAQYAALEHPNVDSDDEAVSLDGKLNAVVTVTDGDGDEATDSEAIGNLITFEDDGPTADIALVDEASVTLDETIGGEGAFDDITDSNPDPFNNSYGTPIGAISGIALVDASGSDAGADSDGATTSVSLSLTGAEGSDSGLATTDGTPIDLYTEDDGTITGRTGAEDGDVIFAISINDDGKVSVAQYAALEHPNVDSDDEAVSLDGKLNAVVTVTDGDGDEATDSEAIGNLITFEDDGPTADIALVDEASVTLDETIGGEGAFDDITDSNPDPFNNSYGTPIGAISGIALVDASGSDAGADSDGATTSVSLSLTGAEGSDSGLATTDGTPIDLYTEDDGTITGRTGAEDGDVIFAISINDDGKVSVAQYAALEHPNVDSDDEAVSLDGKLNAVVTVTDGDGDEATDSEAIGNLITFEDDGPTADIALVDEASVTLDETIGGEGAFDDITDSNPDPFNNSYGTPIGAISGIALVDASGSDAGADSDGATTSVSLSLTGAEGSDSGLATTDGTPIDLYTEDDGTITGRTGAEDGDVIFAISINDDGKVSVAQYAALEHPNVDSDDEAVSLDGKLNAVVTVTDGDGDEATDSEAIGNLITFEDDGPTADIALVDEASVTLDETIGGEGAFDDITDSNPDPFNNSYGTPIGAISGIALVDASGSDAGADSDGATTSVSLSLTGAEGSDSGLATTDGTPIDLYTEDDGTITGRTGAEDGDVIFAISINDDGKVSVAQYAALEHPNVDSDDEAVSLDGKLNAVVTVTDGDGDEATDSEAIGNLITFEDDGPTADIALVDEASVTLDETIGGEGAFDDITDSNPDPFNNSYGTPIGAISGIALVDASGSDAGADSDGATTSVSLSLTGAEGSDSGLATTDGTPIDLYTEDDGTITGRTGAEDGDVIFAISINDDGKVSVAQYAALEHPNVDSDDEAVSLDGKLNAVVTVTDGDGDEATDSEAIGNLITFEDDGPTADIALVDEASVTLDETIGGEGAFDDITDSNPDPFNNSYGTPIGAISGIALVDASGSDAGADSDGATTSVSLSLTGAEGSDSGLATTDGTPIDLYTEDDGTITGRTGAEDGDVIFAISINDDGKVSVAQYAALEHPNVDSDDEAVSLDGKLNAVVTVTDGDGDEATDSEAIGNLITFEDDGPTADIALVDEASVTLDETIGGEGAFDDITDSNPDPFNNSYGTPIGAISGIALVDASGSDAGADSDGATTSVSLSLTGAEGSDSGLATTDGTPIDLYTEDDGTITGRTGAEDGDVIFAISINDDGKVSVAQYAALEHPNVDSDDEAVSLDGKLNAVVTVTDGDGDEATDSEAIGNLITFEDDGPSFINPDIGFLVNDPDSAFNTFVGKLDLDGQVEDNFGADQDGKVRFSATNGTESTLTSNGAIIYLYVSEDDQTLIGSTFGDEESADSSVQAEAVFTVNLSVNSDGEDTYDLTLHQQIDGGAGSFTTTEGDYDFSGGNKKWVSFDSEDGPNQDILITPINGSTINTTDSEGGTAGVANTSVGSSKDGDQAVRVDYVTNLGGTESSGGSYDVNSPSHTFDGHYTVNGATAILVDADDTTINIKAFDYPDNYNGDLVGGNVTGHKEDVVTRVVINYQGIEGSLDLSDWNAGESDEIALVDDEDEVVGTYNVTLRASGVDISGLDAGVQVGVSTQDGFNSIEYHYVSGGDFQVGGFGGVSFTPGDAVDLGIDLDIIDGDGDNLTIMDAIKLQLAPDTHIVGEGGDGEDTLMVDDGTEGMLLGGSGNDTMTGNSGNDIISGGEGNDTIQGVGGDNFLYGGAGDDTIEGDTGNDIIIGGPGDDILIGGAGADTFVWNLGDESNDTNNPADDVVQDFQEGLFGTDVDADRLDLADLLQGEDENDIGTYIFAEQDGSDLVLHISSTGALNGSDGAGADQKITLEGKSFNEIDTSFDSNTSSEDLITKLIDKGQLDID
ncbi:retention module-containing protein [Halomonas sp. BLK-85]